MARLIRIGNAQGLLIPNHLIEQAMLEGKELRLEVLESGGLLVYPISKARAGWAEQIQVALQKNGDESLDSEWLEASLIDESHS